jgi:hypothetical protein
MSFLKITLKQDVNDQYIIEFESPTERVVISAYSVLELVPSKANSLRFSLVFKVILN